MIVDKIFDKNNTSIPSDFGIILNNDNINNIISQTKKTFLEQ